MQKHVKLLVCVKPFDIMTSHLWYIFIDLAICFEEDVEDFGTAMHWEAILMQIKLIFFSNVHVEFSSLYTFPWTTQY